MNCLNKWKIIALFWGDLHCELYEKFFSNVHTPVLSAGRRVVRRTRSTTRSLRPEQPSLDSSGEDGTHTDVAALLGRALHAWKHSHDSFVQKKIWSLTQKLGNTLRKHKGQQKAIIFVKQRLGVYECKFFFRASRFFEARICKSKPLRLLPNFQNESWDGRIRPFYLWFYISTAVNPD